MIVPGKHDFILAAGSTLDKSFVWKSNNVAVNLTGFTAHCQFRLTLSSTTAALDLTTTNGGIVLDPTNGKFSLYASSAATSLLYPTSAYRAETKLDTVIQYVYDIKLIDTSGKVFPMIRGVVSVLPEATR